MINAGKFETNKILARQVYASSQKVLYKYTDQNGQAMDSSKNQSVVCNTNANPVKHYTPSNDIVYISNSQ